MWYRLAFLPALLLTIFTAEAQEKPYLFREEIDSLLLHDSTPFRFQKASWLLSYIGEHQLALEYKDRQFPQATAGKPAETQRAQYAGYTSVNAVDYILKRAAAEQIIIINEAHHIALHREFLRSLLPQLYALGYKHLGMEALDYKDSMLNKRGYPVIESGYYCREPSMGNLIREALQLKIDVFAYEQITTNKGQGAMSREKAEATNIAMHMKKYPGEKYIIYCGYDHAAEDTLNNFMGLPMAGQLKAMTGIDPFTIDQTTLTEYYLVGNRYRKLMDFTAPTVFTDSAGNMFNLANLPKRMDINLYHPNTRYINGRPNWKENNTNEPYYPQLKINIAYPCLVKVYKEDDLPQAVPIDIIEVNSAQDMTAVYILKNAKQKIVVNNLAGEEQIIYLK